MNQIPIPASNSKSIKTATLISFKSSNQIQHLIKLQNQTKTRYPDFQNALCQVQLELGHKTLRVVKDIKYITEQNLLRLKTLMLFMLEVNYEARNILERQLKFHVHLHIEEITM